MDILVIAFRETFKKMLIRNVEQFPNATVIICTHLSGYEKYGKIVKCHKDDSIGKKRNLLLDFSKNRIKMFIDEDDIQLPGRAVLQYNYMIKHGLEICCPRLSLHFDSDSKKCWKAGSSSVIEGSLMFIGKPKKRFVERNALEGYPFMTCKEFGYFDDQFELYIQIKHKNNTIFKEIPKNAWIDMDVADYVDKFNRLYFNS